MAQLYKTVKFNYNGTTYSASVPIENIDLKTDALETIKQTISGKRWSVITGRKRTWNFSFSGDCDKSLFDFFNNAAEFNYTGGTVTMQIETTIGNFESVEVLMRLPTYIEDTLLEPTDPETEKIYKDLACEVLER